MKQLGLRRVKPYFYQHKMHAKARWIGRPILSVFTQEFRNRNADYYERAIKKGWITVNEEAVSADTIVHATDVLKHAEHFHEKPTTARPLCIIHSDDDLLVIDKPSGLPVHSSGRFRYNTVVEILKSTLGLSSIYPVNRLDRHTSGLVLLALTPQRASEIAQDMKGRVVQKEYLCRVLGKFPSGKVVCNVPIKPISFKLSLHYAHADGKPCATEFERVSYNGQTSVVRCRPLTGRTHQIRVHLRYLGYPIVNDPMYHTTFTPWFPPPMTCINDTDAEQVVQHLLETTQYELQQNDNNSSNNYICPECNMLVPEDPRPETSLGIYLHAWRYRGNGWDYKTELPHWIYEPFNEPITPASIIK
ncbi:pseudouridine synthase, partial [Zychaea mexicana]|uniref:pseudouridine synthase n=1 Tax=Zychaea mexicana TaxID=64656 RepID=UPI0022FE81B4